MTTISTAKTIAKIVTNLRDIVYTPFIRAANKNASLYPDSGLRLMSAVDILVTGKAGLIEALSAPVDCFSIG